MTVSALTHVAYHKEWVPKTWDVLDYFSNEGIHELPSNENFERKMSKSLSWHNSKNHNSDKLIERDSSHEPVKRPSLIKHSINSIVPRDDVKLETTELHQPKNDDRKVSLHDNQAVAPNDDLKVAPHDDLKLTANEDQEFEVNDNLEVADQKTLNDAPSKEVSINKASVASDSLTVEEASKKS